MTGMIKLLSSLFLVVILSGCMKTTCVSPHKCEKKVDWNNPGFKVVRTIITQGTNVGKQRVDNHPKIWYINMMTIEDIKIHIPEEVRKLKLFAQACANAQDNDFKALWYKKMIDYANKHNLMDYVMTKLVH